MISYDKGFVNLLNTVQKLFIRELFFSKNDHRTSARTCHRNATELFQHNWPHKATLYDYLTLEFMAIGQCVIGHRGEKTNGF